MDLRVLAGIVCLCSPLCLSAQQKVDSLEKLVSVSLKSRDNRNLSSLYANLGYHYINTGSYDSCIYFYKKSLAFERQAPNPELKASNLNAIASAFAFLSRTDSCIYYYQNALNVYVSLKDTVNAAVIETNLSILFKNLALYDRSLEYAFTAIKKHEQLGEWQSLGSAYSTVSLVYLKIRDYPNALKYGYKALETRKRIKYVKGEGLSYNNIGEIYLAMRDYDSALVNLNKALKIKKESNDRKSLSNTLINLGIALFDLGRISQSEKHFQEALELKTEFRDLPGEAVCYNNLARIALHFEQSDKADQFLRRAEDLLKELDAPEVHRETLELRIQFSELTGQSQLAVRHMRELMAVKDSILSDEKAESMNALQIRYETEKKEQQIMLLEEQAQLKSVELRAKQLMIYGLSAVASLLLVIAGLVFNNFRLARKGKIKQELLNKELNHRVKNNLQLLASVLSLQSQELTEEAAVTLVKSNESRVNAMALIHRKLYYREESRTIDLREYVRELVDFLLYSFSYENEDIKLTFDLDEIQLDVDKAIPIGLILNEAISNSLKYAFHSQPDPAIEVKLKLGQSRELLLQVRDNGIGIASFSPDAGPSFGLKMMHLLTRELKGTLKIERDEGTVVTINIRIHG
jgi:two-component system, sensor histidine kinase PdtaS